MRKLASIQRVHNIQDIEGKDKLKTCNVLGWQVLINTDLGIKENDLVVYVEIDSILPKKEEFAFLEKNKYRIKTMKMAGRVSEGIVFPISILPKKEYKEGQDVTDLVGVVKYESATERQDHAPKKKISKLRKFVQRWAWGRKYFPTTRKQRNGFPTFVKKTDETRIQNIPFILDDGRQYIGHEKVDGSSATYAIKRGKKGYEFFVLSRNVNLSAKKGVDYWGEDVANSAYHRIAEKYKMEETLTNIMDKTDFKSVTIQGEIIGPKIQGNKYKLQSDEIEFYMFNLVVDEVPYYMEYNVGQFETIQNEIDHIKQVPLTGVLKNYGSHKMTIPELMDFVTFQSTLNKETLAEGMVFRSYNEDGTLHRSFKAVSPTFLIKNKE